MVYPTKIINLSLQRKVYNLSFEKEFSDVEETGILISFNEMYPDKRDRHKNADLRQLFERMKKRFPEIKDEYFSKLSKKRIK